MSCIDLTNTRKFFVAHVSVTKFVFIFSCLISLRACDTTSPLFGPGALAVDTPVYRANRVFYLEPRDVGTAPDVRLYYDLIDPVVSSRGAGASSAKNIKNGEPVTIVINKAYIPNDTADGKLDKTRDIAVLLDLGLGGDGDETIAVWYQRNVPVNEELSFSNIPVFSIDARNSDLPPRFRVRLIDVTAERNARTSELLKIAANLGGSAVSLIGTPAAGLAVSLATQAAKVVLANEKNRALVDFEFYFFSSGQLAQAGGAPLSLFRRGAMVVTGRPNVFAGAPVDESFWDTSLQYDHGRKRLQKFDTGGPGERVDSPYILATVMTADALISNLVKQRSAYITSILTSAAPAVQADIGGLKEDAETLLKSLQVLESRQGYRNFPTSDNFGKLVDAANTNAAALPSAELNYMLYTIRNASGVLRSDATGYNTWWTACKDKFKVESESRKIVPVNPATLPDTCK